MPRSAGYGGRRGPGRWRWDEGQEPTGVSPNPLWLTREGGLGIHGVATRQPRCRGSAKRFQTTGSQGARKVPGRTWAEPASCRATACHSHGDRPGVGGRRGLCLQLVVSVPRAASHLWPLQRVWGRGTSERPQDQVRTGKLSLPWTQA